MKYVFCFSLMCLFLAGCASEDESIVNPPPGTSKVVVRLFNMVPDAQPRRLVMEQGLQTQLVMPGALSATVPSPGDSSLLQIFTGSTLSLTTEKRQQFTRNSVYDVYAIASTQNPTSFDTVFVSNANAALLTLPVAQVRFTNTIPDSTRSFEVRIGCPNGMPLSSTPVPFAQSSLYKEVLPGNAVFSVIEQRTENGSTTSNVLGTYEADLEERGAYAIIMYRDASGDNARIMFVQQEDTTANATRSFSPISARDAFVRVINLNASQANVQMPSAGTVLTNNLNSLGISQYNSVGTCRTDAADVFELQYGGVEKGIDSTALTVRGRYTLYASDTAGTPRIIITPPLQRPFGSTGKAVIRVVHASSTIGGVVVTVGSRTTSSGAQKIAPGLTLARDIRYDSYSAPMAIEPGVLPLSITTARTPTSIIQVTQAVVEADKSYDIVVYNDGATEKVALIEETDQSKQAVILQTGTFLRYLNANSGTVSETTTIGNVVQSGTTFYRDQITTVVAEGATQISSGGVNSTITTTVGQRTLVILADGGSGKSLLEFTNTPFAPSPGVLQRRVINATQDIANISVAIDSIPKQTPDANHLIKDIAYGTSSAVLPVNTELRGTLFFYDAQTFKEVFTLPTTFAPLGTSNSLIVIGSASKGYEVIVLQEF